VQRADDGVDAVAHVGREHIFANELADDFLPVLNKLVVRLGGGDGHWNVLSNAPEARFSERGKLPAQSGFQKSRIALVIIVGMSAGASCLVERRRELRDRTGSGLLLSRAANALQKLGLIGRVLQPFLKPLFQP